MKITSLSSPKPGRSLNSTTVAFALRLVVISAFLVGVVSVSLLYLIRPAYAATCNSTGTGNWSNISTWSCGHVPISTDDVSILTGHTVSYDGSSTVLSLTTAGTGTLSFNDSANRSLTVSGTVINGGVIQAVSAAGTRTYTLNVGGDFTNNGTFTPAGGDEVLNVVLNGTTQTIGGSNATTFNNLTINSGSTTQLTVGVSPVINTTIIINGTIVMPDTVTITNDGTATVTLGSTGLIQTADADGVTGLATTSFGLNFTTASINSNGTVEYNRSGAQTVTGRTYQNLSTSGSGTKTLSAGGTTINSAFTIGSGATVDVAAIQPTVGGGGSVVVNGILDFTNASGFIQSGTTATTTLTMGSSGLIRTSDDNGLGPAASASLQTQAGGAWNVTSISTNGTVEYNRTSAQTVTDRDYNNLTITNTGVKTWILAADRTANGTVTLNASAPLTLVNTQTVNVKGDWSNSGTFTAGTSTVNFNGAANQTIGGSSSTTFSTLAISNTGSAPAGTNKVSLANNTTVSTALNVTSGIFDQGPSSNLTSNTINVSAGATLQNLGTGDLTLSGDVANAGAINYNANGNTCGDIDDILIRSSASPTQRLWTGLGTFSMTDVDVKDQAGTAVIVVTSGTNSGNNGVTWTFVAACPGAQTYTWVGPIAGTDSYTNPANWSPTRFISNVNDVLVIDGTTRPAPSISSVPTETIARLQLINGTDATLTTSAANTLTIAGGAGTDLDIANASRLILSGSSPITISLATGATANISSFMVFQGGAHRLLAADAGAVTFPGASIFTTSTGFTGNAFGTTNAGSIIFASGSAYVHNAGSSPFGSVGGAVVCVFQTGSEARYLTATGFDANGRKYANLTIGDGSSAITASDSGAGNFQFDNLAINSPGSAASSSLTYVGSGSSTITIQGNITSVGNGNGGTFPDLMLTAGTGDIQIKVPGAGGTISFGNQTGPARGIDFESNATVDTNTTVNLGRIVQMGLSPDKTITVNGTIVPNYLGTAGYFIGKEKRTFAGPGPVDFSFDVGTINGYSPVDAQNTNAAGDLTATATQTNAPVVNASTSLKRYWTLNGSGITTDLTFHYLDPTDIAGNEANYSIIRVESGTSVSFPNSCPSGSACVDFANNQATIQAVSAFSDWTLGENVAPTEVRLTNFSATTQDDGVMLEWRSGFEANNLGYNLYRYQDGQRTRVTPSLIAGSSLIRKHGGDLASGFSYGWFDSQGTVGTQYELQAVDLHGDVQTFSPRYVAKPWPGGDQKQDRALTLSEVSAANAGAAAQRGWANDSPLAASIKQTNPPATQALATQQWIASQPSVKIRVNQTGWYRVTQPQLVANGFDSSVDARKLQLYVDGAEVPIRLSTDKSKLGSGDTLEFYGVGLDALTTDTRTYYLVNGPRSGLRIPNNPEKGKVRNDTLAPDFLYTVESKERIDYFPGLLNGDKGNIFGQFIESVPANQTLTLQNIDTSSNADAKLEVVIQGYTEADHHIQVQFNGSYVGTIDFTGTRNKSKTLTVGAALLREGANTVTLTATGGDLDFGAVDVMRITYAHTYRADKDSLSFSVGNRSALVTGFSSPAIRVIDITNPNAVVELAPKINSSGGSYGFTIQTTGAVQNLIAFLDSLTRQPSAIVKNHPATWNAGTNAANMLIVTHGDFRASADTLAAARRAQGMKVSVVDVEDIYDEFSYGVHTPEALRDFLHWSNTHWATAPKYALLFGDSSWDPRNFMGQGYSDFVPTKLVDTAEFETASDDWLADFNGDGIPEIALGRLPARTKTDASTMISKILNYDHERAGGAPLRGALLVADSSFESQSAQVQSFLAPLTTVQTLNRSAIGNDDTMRTQIVSAIDQGPAIVNYFGHGSVGVWTGAGLLNQDNGSTLSNGNRVSLFVMMTCLNGYSHDAYIDSLAETLLKDPQGGAFAVWASSGATEPVGQAQMNTRLYQSLLGNQRMTLGDAVRQAKMATSDSDVRRTWILFGDPSMRLK